jgi:hypothetical protein
MSPDKRKTVKSDYIRSMNLYLDIRNILTKAGISEDSAILEKGFRNSYQKTKSKNLIIEPKSKDLVIEQPEASAP